MGELISRLPSVFDRPDALARVGTATAPVVLLDFDGTLAPIVDDPSVAALPETTRRTLRRLASRCPVAIVSGRDLDDVHARTAVDGVFHAGNHGLEIREPGGSVHAWQGPDLTAALDRAGLALAGALRAVEGVRIERKRFGVAVHLRTLSRRADEPVVRRAVETVSEREPTLRLTVGKELLELRPADPWNKGHAVLWILDTLADGRGEPLPVYVGDDVTDEDAFRALEGRGLRVVVAGAEDRESRADLSVAGPAEVGSMLAALERMIERSAVAGSGASVQDP